MNTTHDEKLPQNAADSNTTLKPEQAIGPSGQKSDGRLNFTKTVLEALKPPDTGRAYYNDDKVRGLRLTVFATGTRTFQLYRWIVDKETGKGRAWSIDIGRFPDLTIDQARAEAQRLNGLIAQGKNPAAEKRVMHDEWTLDELVNDYFKDKGYAKTYKAKTWYQEQSTFNCHLKERFGPLKLSAITNSKLHQLHTAISVNHPYAANRAIELAVSLFKFAASHHAWTGNNPARGIKANPEEKRERFLHRKELELLFQALVEEENEMMRDYFTVCLFTGGRSRRNTAAMRWDEIHWDRSVWVIPGWKFKNGKQEENLLIPEIVALLQNRKSRADADPVWVFPGRGKTGHLVEPKNAWKRILKRAGITDCRMHDLRRTYGSWQAISGSSLPIIGASLGHKSPDSTAIYARLHSDPVRESIERATRAMMLEGKMPKGLLPERSDT